MTEGLYRNNVLFTICVSYFLTLSDCLQTHSSLSLSLSQTDQFPPGRVHHGCWILHGSHSGEDCPELSRGGSVSGGEVPPDGGQQEWTWPWNRSWSGGERPTCPCWLSGPLPLSLLHALPLPLPPLSFWRSCYWPAEHRLKGKTPTSTTPDFIGVVHSAHCVTGEGCTCSLNILKLSFIILIQTFLIK